MTSLADLFKKAHGALVNFRSKLQFSSFLRGFSSLICSGGNNVFFGKDGDIVYSKNNVCVHEVVADSEKIVGFNRLMKHFQIL